MSTPKAKRGSAEEREAWIMACAHGRELADDIASVQGILWFMGEALKRDAGEDKKVEPGILAGYVDGAEWLMEQLGCAASKYQEALKPLEPMS